MNKVFELKINRPNDKKVEVNFLELGHYIKDEDKYIDSFKNLLKSNDKKLDLNNVSLAWRSPKIKLPREKAALVAEKYNFKFKRDRQTKNLDMIVTSLNFIDSFISQTWCTKMPAEDILEVVEEHKDLIINYDECITMLSKIEIDFCLSSYYYHNDNKFADALGQLRGSSSRSNYVKYIKKEAYEDFEYLYSNQNKLVSDNRIYDIASEDSVTIDKEMYRNIVNMIISSDEENLSLGMESLANSNIEKSKGYIAMIFYLYSERFKHSKTYNHVNFKALRKQFDIYTTNGVSYYPYPYESFLNKMLDQNLLDTFILKTIHEQLVKNVIHNNLNWHNSLFDITIELKDEHKKKLTDYKMKEIIKESADLPF
tara:strand:- start:1740 stop:2846 length:1107 start_codon:yes stop_codon:yes gene_type:complete